VPEGLRRLDNDTTAYAPSTPQTLQLIHILLYIMDITQDQRRDKHSF